jgi:dTMP kinase
MGMLISFEGIDGSGKSTQAALLKERIESEGQPALLVREPGGTVLSERIRTLLLDPDVSIQPLAELLLFAASRAQLVQEQIMPALAARKEVICDRFFDSTTVYQGVGRGLDVDGWLAPFNLRVTGGLSPVRTYLIDIDPAEAARRRAMRGGRERTDRMEASEVHFYERIVAAYRSLARAEPHRWLVLNGLQSVDQIHEHIWLDYTFQTQRSRNTPV